jgi:hypothetical protein
MDNQRNQEYWKAAVAYHERELAEQRRLLKRARAKLAQAEKEAEDGRRTTEQTK